MKNREIVGAVTKAIKECYPNAKVTDTNINQNLDIGDFYVNVTMANRDGKLENSKFQRAIQRNNVTILWYGGTQMDTTKAHEVIDNLMDNLYEVEFNNLKLRAKNIQYFVQSNGINFQVNYNIQLIRVTENEEDLMQNKVDINYIERGE